jgi:hypothetical protein
MYKLITQLCLIIFLFAVPLNADCISNDWIGLQEFVSKWLEDDCIKSDWCGGADINQSHDVDFVDFAMAFGPVDPLILVNNGICNVSIHNVSVPSTVETYATQQLQAAFQSACGVMPLINPSTPAAIQIRLGVASRFNVGVGNSDEQAYAVRRTYDNKIELVGNSTSSVMWAVDDFCKQVLHVSWPIANDILVLEDGPQSTVTVGRLCKVEAPDFHYRGWIIGDNADGMAYNNLIGNWMAHNRQNTLYQYIQYMGTTNSGSYASLTARGIEPETTMHNFSWYVPRSLFATHPEYFPLIGDVRQYPADDVSTYMQLCLSNPDVFNIVVNKIVTTFGTYQKLKIAGVAQNDGSGGWCQCPNCRAWDGDQLDTGVYSNRLIHFINLLADYLGPSYPGRYIGTYAYQQTMKPPSISISDNVAITFCMGDRNYMKKLTDSSDACNAAIMTDLNGWLNRAKNVHFWEYYYLDSIDMAFCLTPYARTICEEYGDLKALGLKGACSETIPSWGPSLRVFSYTTARTGWDTSLDYNDILADYCYAAYGPAASYMKSYHLLYESKIYEHVPALTIYGAAAQLFPSAFTSGDLNTLDSYLTSAAAAAATGSKANIDAVTEVSEMNAKFKLLSIDPCDIPGIGPNLVPNPGAESSISGNWAWNLYGGIGDYVFSVSTTVAHSGSKSLEINYNGVLSPAARWYQTGIPVTAGKKYAVRFWVRASGGAHGPTLLVDNNAYTFIGWVDSNNQWVRIIVPEVTATSSTFDLYLTNSGTGTVYFDDVFIGELPD